MTRPGGSPSSPAAEETMIHEGDALGAGLGAAGVAASIVDPDSGTGVVMATHG